MCKSWRAATNRRKFKPRPPYMWLSDPQQEECVIVILPSYAHNFGRICHDPDRSKMETCYEFITGSFMIQTVTVWWFLSLIARFFFFTSMLKVCSFFWDNDILRYKEMTQWPNTENSNLSIHLSVSIPPQHYYLWTLIGGGRTCFQSRWSLCSSACLVTM